MTVHDSQTATVSHFRLVLFPKFLEFFLTLLNIPTKVRNSKLDKRSVFWGHPEGNNIDIWPVWNTFLNVECPYQYAEGQFLIYRNILKDCWPCMYGQKVALLLVLNKLETELLQVNMGFKHFEICFKLVRYQIPQCYLCSKFKTNMKKVIFWVFYSHFLCDLQ